ncbi:protein AGENET DOMAIN (AGD)-CONTAINING P1-like isoform X2 [Lycium barbarum]|uniref:protein AGENET DOMAIN (AGD)-CONTAINING P1-like isoform X2 n=1 Tax=Lycium barbarum TaxID=112863 RepID=UPI00293EDAE0|nr:protein AGENET DOMAIN (AGD)-CONTAINING P1-like isoform X2 [Lycium barbarum]
MQCFNKGDAVEVLKTHPYTIWFPATILRSTPTKNGQIYVEFNTLSDRREYVNVGDVRPTPPQELHKYFKVGDNVEVLYQEKGWRKGKVNDILQNSMYLVSLLDEGDEIVKVEQWCSRVYRHWDHGSWVPPLQKNIPEVELKSRRIKLRIKCSRCWKETFNEGMSVEVKRDKEGCYGSWHTAVIVEAVGYDKFLVEYQKLKAVNGSQFLKEEADASCIRPCPPEIRSFHPFEHLDRVDAWINDGWWEAHIIDVLGGFNYVVCLLTTEEELVFEHSMLRPHQDWVKGKWVTAREFDMPTSSSDMTLKSKELKIRIKCSGTTSEPKFSKGIRVEVRSDEEGYQGSWYTAVIVDSIGQHKFLVEYLTLRTEDESEPLREKADASDIRPCPPLIQRIDRFKMLEEVDAWYNEGWWVGLICKILDGLKYMVYFWTTNEELEFDHFTLRPHQDWIDGKWVIAFMKKPQIEVKPKLKGQRGGVAKRTNFCVGAKVEVKSDEEGYQGSWYPAKIVRPLGNEKYLLQYQTLETDDETDLLTEEADTLSIRPYPPLIQQHDQFRPLDEVDAWYNGGWWAGQVCKVLKGSNYTVYFPTANEILEFQHSDLRPHQNWLDGEWVAAKRALV